MDNTKASMVEPRYLVMKLVRDSHRSPRVQRVVCFYVTPSTQPYSRDLEWWGIYLQFVSVIPCCVVLYRESAFLRSAFFYTSWLSTTPLKLIIFLH